MDRRAKPLSEQQTSLFAYIICIICWIIGYLYYDHLFLQNNLSVLPLLRYVDNMLNSKLLLYVSGIAITLVIALFMQRLCDRDMLIRERTRLPFILYLLLTGTNISLHQLNEITLATLCLAIALYKLCDIYQNPEATGITFNIGALTGIAGLFVPQSLWFLPLFLIGLYQLRAMSLKNFLATLTGMFTIYWFATGWCVWKHDFGLFKNIFSILKDVDLLDFHDFTNWTQTGNIFIIILLLIAIIFVRYNAFNNSIRARNMLSLLQNMSVWTLFLILFYSNHLNLFISFLYLPSVILMSYFFENMRNKLRFILFYLMLAILFYAFIIRIWSF